MTAGCGMANWERGNSSDSGYAIWDGMEYMDVNHNFHLWDSVCYYLTGGSSPPYGLHVISTYNIRVDATPDGLPC